MTRYPRLGFQLIVYCRSSTAELEPIVTLRGHTASITALAITTSLQTICSASLDATIRVWRLPPTTHDPYGPYDSASAMQILEGHTDAVWDLCLLSSSGSGRTGAVGQRSGEGRLVSASADGSIKIWSLSPGGQSKWTLTSSFADFGDGVVPTCLSVFNLDLSTVLVGLSNGVLKLFDVGRTEEVASFGEESDGEHHNAWIAGHVEQTQMPRSMRS